MTKAAEHKGNENEMTGTQLALHSLDEMIATAEHIAKLCDDFIAGQTDRDRIYGALIRQSTNDAPRFVAVRPETKAKLNAILSEGLKRVRQEPGLK